MRFPELLEQDMSEAQKVIFRHAVASPRGRLGPPTSVLLRCPALALRTQRIGDYVRFGSSLPARISEFAIIITARYWSAPYEWNAHCQLAIKAGLSVSTATALAAGELPAGMNEDEAAAWDFCTELHRDKQVGDATFAPALKQFGEQGIAELTVLCGYYSLISICLNLNPRAWPAGAPPQLADLPQERVIPLRSLVGAALETDQGPDRFPELREEQMSEAQRTAVREIVAGPARSVSMPIGVLLRSPELAMLVQRVAEYLRFDSGMPARLMHFAVIITARYWRSETMWHAHSRSAMEGGLPACVVADLLAGRTPAGLQPDEEAVHRFCTELHRDKSVTDDVFDQAMKVLGEQQTVNLMAVCGHYTLAAMALKLARKALPAGVALVFSSPGA